MSSTTIASQQYPALTGAERRAVIAGTLGNILEWYNFGVYGFLVPSLAIAFFPHASPFARLLYTFGVFGVGFFMRPIGSVVIGFYGDRAGRRAALVLTVGLMGLSTLAIGLLPTYAAAGIWAPILLTVARLVQGFSAGGEWGGAAAFLVEYAPTGRRGYIGSWQQFSVGSGLLLGSLLATLLAATLGRDAMAAWAWRIPFLVGILIAGFAIYFRLRLPDTPEFEAVERSESISANPLRDLIADHGGMLVTQFGITIHNTITYYITLAYLPTWLTSVVKLPQSESLAISTIGLLLLVCLIPPLGALSDRVGRKPLLIASCLGFIVPVLPALSLCLVRHLHRRIAGAACPGGDDGALHRRRAGRVLRALSDPGALFRSLRWIQHGGHDLRRVRPLHRDMADRADRKFACTDVLRDCRRRRVVVLRAADEGDGIRAVAALRLTRPLKPGRLGTAGWQAAGAAEKQEMRRWI